MSSPLLLGYLDLVVWCSGTVTVKEVLPCVICDSGIGLVEGHLHLVKKSKNSYAGTPRVWLHFFALRDLMGPWAWHLHSPFWLQIGDNNSFHLSFVHFYWVTELRMTDVRVWVHKHRASLISGYRTRINRPSLFLQHVGVFSHMLSTARLTPKQAQYPLCSSQKHFKHEPENGILWWGACDT